MTRFSIDELRARRNERISRAMRRERYDFEAASARTWNEVERLERALIRRLVAEGSLEQAAE